MPNLLASPTAHTLTQIDSLNAHGEITLDAVATLNQHIGLEFAYTGNVTLATIEFTTAGGSPQLPVGAVPFIPGDIYELATNAAEPVSYDIVFTVARSAALLARATTARAVVIDVQERRSHTAVDSDEQWTAGVDLDVATGDHLVLSVLAKPLNNKLSDPTVTSGFTLIETANVAHNAGQDVALRAWTKDYAGETTIDVTVPSGWASGGWSTILFVVRDGTAPDAASSESAADGPSAPRTHPLSSITDGLVTAWCAGMSNTAGVGTSINGWVVSSAGGVGFSGYRSTAVGPMIGAPQMASLAAVSLAAGIPSTIDELFAGLPYAVRWRLGSSRIGRDRTGW